MNSGDKDTIAISWCIDDLKWVAEDRGLDVTGLTDDDFRDVLGIVVRRHDACIGINWDVLECHLEMYIDDLKENK